ncbi:hypothetical protein BDA99DRAFT_306370 [Phascolomyces articulosus]|uniref:Uncharacterized protein n=1 Tax=Phascolomyces articulosus TaxID=60185 RepID=A0AAD5PHH5_9FUNG|nr:hypothetical protein BDA99DRAFT_306370 [Phascolomyces articulosus]
MTRRLEQFKSVTTLDLSCAPTLSSRAARTFVRDLYQHDREWTLRLPLGSSINVLKTIQARSDRPQCKIKIETVIQPVAITTTNTTTALAPSPVTSNALDENTAPSQPDMSIRAQPDMSIRDSGTGLTNRDTNKISSSIPLLGRKRPNSTTNTPLDPKDINLDEWETPVIAREVKRLAILAGEVKKIYPRPPTPAVPTTTNEEIPRPAHRLMNHGEYRKLDVSTPISDSRFPPNAAIKNMDDIQAAIIEYGSQLLESIIMFDSNWFFITSMDVFWHNSPSTDDCADGAEANYQDTLKAILKTHKTSKGSYFHELSVYIGYLEFQMNGGFFGDNLNQKPKSFLGSAIHGLPKSLQETKTSNTMFILEICPEFTQSNRHLRQYAKASSLLPWSLQSLRFVKCGMYPINPLAFDSHVVFGSNKTVSIHMVVSIIIRSIAEGTMEKQTLARIRKMLARIDVYKHHLDNKKKSLKQLQTKLQGAANISRYAVAVIDVLVKMEQEIQTGDSEENLTAFIVREKDTVLDRIMNGGYSGAITQQNKKICSNFEKNYADTL